MATFTLAPNVKRQFLDNSGNPLASGKIYTIAAGGTYPADAITTYQTSSGTAHTNPIVLDAAGRVSGSSEIYLTPGLSYKFIASSSTDDYTVPLWTQDNITAVPPSSVNVDIQGTFGVSASAGDLMYLSDGSGSLSAGSWYKADADLTYAGVYPELAFAVNDVTAGASGTLRKDGQITLAGPLTPGAHYYVSATAGSITATAPANMRYVGQAQSTTLFCMSPTPILETINYFVDPRIKDICDGRLTLTSGTPVTTADVTAAGTLYFAPYVGNQIGLYSGTAWVAYTFTQLSIAVPAVGTQMYDVFVDYNDGSPALALTAWTSDTARATALTTQDSVLVKTGDTQQRYVGSVRTVSASQLNDSFALRHVWNYYNRVNRPMRVLEATNSWTYTTATMRQANGATTNQLDFVCGVAEDGIEATVYALFSQDNTGVSANVAIGLDVTNAAATGCLMDRVRSFGAGDYMAVKASLRTIPAIGRHFLAWLEYSDAGVGTTTWYGDNNVPTLMQMGIHGMWRA